MYPISNLSPDLVTGTGSTNVNQSYHQNRQIASTMAHNSDVAFAGPTTEVVSHSQGNKGAAPKEKLSKSARQSIARKPPPTIDNFWPSIISEVRAIKHVDAKHQALPLARIKKIMKLDDNAKMIAAEAPLLFAKACEYFIQELTMRAWVHTEESKRRTLQRSDIAQAIANYDQFDFLIDIVPREDIKPSANFFKKDLPQTNTQPQATTSTGNVPASSINVKSEPSTLGSYSTMPTESISAMSQTTTTQHPQPQSQPQPQPQPQSQPQAQAHAQPQQLQIIQQAAPSTQMPQMQYFITLPGQQPGQPQIVQIQPQQMPNGLGTTQMPTAAAGFNLIAQQQPQQLIITASPSGQLTATPASAAPTTAAQYNMQQLQTLAQHQHINKQQIQLIQQAITPSGEITNVPVTINANQLNLLRLQMQQQQQPQQHQTQQHQQQVIIPAQCIGTQQLLQLSTNPSTAGNNPTTTQGVQQQQQQQQQHGHPNHANNLFINTAAPQTIHSLQTTTDRNLGGSYRTNC